MVTYGAINIHKYLQAISTDPPKLPYTLHPRALGSPPECPACCEVHHWDGLFITNGQSWTKFKDKYETHEAGLSTDEQLQQL